MTWILIAVVLLAAFGPVLWLVPSRKDRRLSALRSRGRAEDLVVEMRRIPDPDPTPADRVSAGGKVKTPVIECATYGRSFPRQLKHLPQWRVVRFARSGEPADPFPGWSYDVRPSGAGRRYLEEMLPPANALLEALPDDVQALEITPRMARLYWLEKPGSTEETVSAMAAELRRFEAAVLALDTRIAEESRDIDS